MTTVRLRGPGEAAVLDRVAEGVFANPVDPRWAAEFFADLSVACPGDPPTDLDPGGWARETLPTEDPRAGVVLVLNLAAVYVPMAFLGTLLGRRIAKPNS